MSYKYVSYLLNSSFLLGKNEDLSRHEKMPVFAFVLGTRKKKKCFETYGYNEHFGEI